MSLINNAGTLLTFGRFYRIEPEGVVPEVDYTEREAADIKRFLEKEVLREEKGDSVPEPEPEPTEEPTPEPEPEPAKQTEQEPTEDIQSMTKDQLQAYAFGNFGAELDLTKKVKTLRKEVAELAENK